MASYSIIKNNPITIDPVTDFADTGWIVSNAIAYHDGCNAGRIGLNMNLSSHETWNFTFEVLDVTSGDITLYVDNVATTTYTQKGVYTVQVINSNPTAKIEFYSTGKNAISYLKTYPELTESNGTTLVFNADEKGWQGQHSYKPEFYHKFLNSLFSFKDGALWEHDVNPIQNNFYGVQYTSKITVVANDKANSQKRFLSLKVDSNQRWGFRKLDIKPNETYPNGMKSILHENNFTLDKGEYLSNFFRDMKDPQFNTEAQALFEGRELEGKLMVLEMECKATNPTELKAIYVYSVEKFSNF